MKECQTLLMKYGISGQKSTLYHSHAFFDEESNLFTLYALNAKIEKLIENLEMKAVRDKQIAI